MITVELNAQIIKIAKKWFGVRDTESKKVLWGDGIQYLFDTVKKGGVDRFSDSFGKKNS